MTPTNPRNYCRSCDQDFASVSLFDTHRVGKHEYTYSEGVKMEPMREDGRRCLSVDETQAKGCALDARGYWFDPAHTAEVRAQFEALAA